uniref:Uncharacterized protein n=1 Tax=Globodera rostochiensis TaxID=31243 RepID=A0A914IGC2_GLORO
MRKTYPNAAGPAHWGTENCAPAVFGELRTEDCAPWRIAHQQKKEENCALKIAHYHRELRNTDRLQHENKLLKYIQPSGTKSSLLRIQGQLAFVAEHDLSSLKPPNSSRLFTTWLPRLQWGHFPGTVHARPLLLETYLKQLVRGKQKDPLQIV